MHNNGIDVVGFVVTVVRKVHPIHWIVVCFWIIHDRKSLEIIGIDFADSHLQGLEKGLDYAQQIAVFYKLQELKEKKESTLMVVKDVPNQN